MRCWLVLEQEEDYPSRWAALNSNAEKIGCTSETLRRWCQLAEYAQQRPTGAPSKRERLKQLGRRPCMKRGTLPVTSSRTPWLNPGESGATAGGQGCPESGLSSRVWDRRRLDHTLSPGWCRTALAVFWKCLLRMTVRRAGVEVLIWS